MARIRVHHATTAAGGALRRGWRGRPEGAADCRPPTAASYRNRRAARVSSGQHRDPSPLQVAAPGGEQGCCRAVAGFSSFLLKTPMTHLFLVCRRPPTLTLRTAPYEDPNRSALAEAGTPPPPLGPCRSRAGSPCGFRVPCRAVGRVPLSGRRIEDLGGIDSRPLPVETPRRQDASVREQGGGVEASAHGQAADLAPAPRDWIEQLCRHEAAPAPAPLRGGPVRQKPDRGVQRACGSKAARWRLHLPWPDRASPRS